MQIFGKESRKQKIYLNSFKDFLIKNTLCYCLAIKYEKFEQFGPYDTYLKVAEDWDLWITLIENGCKVHIIGEFLFQYRKLSSNSLSGQMNKNRQLRYNSWNRIYQKHTATYQLFYSSNILKMIKESNEHQAKNCSQLKSLKHLSVINIVILLAVAIIGGTKLDDTVYEAIIICMAFIAFIISFLRIQRLLNKNAKADFFSVE